MRAAPALVATLVAILTLSSGAAARADTASSPMASSPMASSPMASSYPVPALDPFYATPADIASYADGAIIRSRRVDAKIAFVGINVPLTAWQVAYRSNDANDHPIANVTTILVPQAAYQGTAARRPMIAYQAAEDSTGSQCAPSYSLRTGSNLLTGQEQSIMAQALVRGFVLDLADHEGPNSAFLAGPQSAHVVLDGIRAAQHFTPAGLSPATPVGLWGYSGGGHATAWAAELQHTYAPDLHIAGAAFGGAPPNMVDAIGKLNGQAFAAFMFGGFVGIHNAYPQWNVEKYFNAKGRADFAKASNACIADFGTALAFHSIEADTTSPDVLDQPDNQAIIARINLGQHVPVTPVFDFFSSIDEAIPVTDSRALVHYYCSHGARVVVDEESLFEHVTLFLDGAPKSLDFLANRFENKPLVGSCN